MASTTQFFLRTPTNGVDQSKQSFLLAPGSFRYLLNFRPWLGKLTQTPLFMKWANLNQIASTDAGAVRFIRPLINLAGNLVYFVLDETFARFIDPSNLTAQTQVLFVTQTKVPSNETIQGQVLLYGVSGLDFVAGDTFTVTIVDATHFKWRKNLGSWSADTAITNGISIGTGLYLGFQTTTGFVAGDTWEWSAAGSPYAGLYPTHRTNFAIWNRDCYIAGYDRAILRLRDDILTSVGYKRIYGKYVGIFYNHLIVGQFAEGTYSAVTGVADTYNPKTTPWRLAWSDRDDPDFFFATLANEADGKTLPASDVNDFTALGITGMAGWKNQFYIYLSDEIYCMTYVGLPNNMQVESLNFKIGCAFQNGLIPTPVGHFFLSTDNVCVFDGSSVQRIGYPVRDLLFSEIPAKGNSERQKLFGYFDQEKMEVVWTYPYCVSGTYYIMRQLIYQIDSGDFYFRNAPHSSMSGSPTIYCQSPKIGSFQKMVYGGSGQQFLLCDGLASEGGNLETNFVKDNISTAGVASYTPPEAQTQDNVFEDLSSMKEITGLLVDAEYANGSGVEVSTSARDLVSTPTFTTLATAWTPSTPKGRLSPPRMSFRAICYRFRGLGALPSNFILRAWGEFIYGFTKDGSSKQIEK